MKLCVFEFNKRIEQLETAILGSGTWEQLQRQYEPQLCTSGSFAVFISVCDKHTRAAVCRGTAGSLAQAWYNAVSAAKKHIAAKDKDAHWIKADIMKMSKREKLSNVIRQIADGRHEYFRWGISFDGQLKSALIEAELNGSRVISYKQDTIELEKVNRHLKSNGIEELSELPDEVLLFDCESYFSDDDGIYPLYGQGLDCGRRVLDRFEKQTALSVINTSSEYLAMQLDLDGRFEYGVYPVFHKPVPGYNMVRHASSVWSLVCAYRITKDKFTLQKIEAALGYLVRHSFYKYKKPKEEENTAYIAELTSKEVKLGGSGVAILVMTEYMDAVGSDRYKKLCIELGNGILEMMDKQTGEFVHVLNFPDLSLKEKTRIVYYDGEAVFALCRLYSLTKDERWLDAARTAVDRFIECGYEKYRDHWIAYSMNELTKHCPKEKYFAFGLKNAQVNLKRIYAQDTTYHTYLELLCVTFELYCRIIDGGYKVDYLSEFDAEFFIGTIFHRAEFMLNGYAYPEYAMYLKYPERVLGAFFVRHDGYRIRIDDIQHFCGAYYSLYRNYERLDDMRSKLIVDKE